MDDLIWCIVRLSVETETDIFSGQCSKEVTIPEFVHSLLISMQKLSK